MEGLRDQRLRYELLNGLFVGVISLLNDRLIAVGKPELGFLDPFLFSICAGALNDITTGSNPGCNTNGFRLMI